ncbi:hypothetical protein BC629DRAFT_1598188 [Irpex lacteus]|nr:hypothetical protein BC629DRAFT_1598188 [Irpex lacteus]
MSTIVDVSSVLGEYMLKGWILSDNICTKCSKVPLMRSKSSPPTEFCANCDGGPVPNSSRKVATHYHNTRRVQAPLARAPRVHLLPHRGKLLLKGWAMLADECQITPAMVSSCTTTKKNGEQSPERNGVCHTVYVDRPGVASKDWCLLKFGATLGCTCAWYLQSNARSRRNTPTFSAPPLASPNASTIRILPDTSVPSHTASNATVRTLQTTVDTLEQSLKGLTERLDYLSNGQAFDANLIGQAADAITKVTQALIKVKELQWSERQASEL